MSAEKYFAAWRAANPRSEFARNVTVSVQYPDENAPLRFATYCDIHVGAVLRSHGHYPLTFAVSQDECFECSELERDPLPEIDTEDWEYDPRREDAYDKDRGY